MKNEKVEQLVANLLDKTEYIIHIRTLKQALNHELVLNKVHRVLSLIKCLAKTLWLIRKKAKNDFGEDLFKLINNAVFGTSMENLRKHRDIKLVITERRRNYLVPEPSYHTTKFFTENLLATEKKKTEILMNKPICFQYQN